MKKIVTIFLLISTSTCFSQQVINITLGSGGSSSNDTSKQIKLVSGSNIKSVNSQTLLGSGDLIVTSTPDPEANFYLSPTGNDGNSGFTKYLPKQTLHSIDTLINASTLATIKVGIEGGGTWNEDDIRLERCNVSFFPYNRTESNKYQLPLFKGTTAHTTGWTAIGTYSYHKAIDHSINVGGSSQLNGYSWMYVIAVDTMLEKIAPLTARKYLKWAVSQASCDATPGSYYGPSSNPPVTPSEIYIHPFDNVSPNNNPKYRYEVVTKKSVVNKGLGMAPYFGQKLSFSDAAVIDYGTGVGSFGNELDSFSLSGTYIQGNAIHQSVFGNYSSVKGCAYVDGDKTIEGGQIVFYKGTGAGETNTVQNSIFLSGQNAVFAHTSGTLPNHGKTLVENCYLYNYYGTAIQSENTDTLDINYCYGDSINYFTLSHAKIVLLRNSIVRQGIAFGYQNSNSLIYNCLFRTQETQQGVAFYGGFATGDKIKITNSILHIKSRTGAWSEAGYVFSNRGDTSSRLVSKNNIIIVDALAGKNVDIASQNSRDGIGLNKDTSDYNAYIIVNGIARWSDYTGIYKYFTLSDWQTASGQDAHSIFIDLRLYEGSLKRIFIDPDAGNYTLTNSPQADSIRAIMAGMPTPPTRWSTLPSREQVLNMVTNKSIPLVSTLFSSASGSENYINVERMTTTQRTATYPSMGRHVFDTTTNKEYSGDGTSWNALW